MDILKIGEKIQVILSKEFNSSSIVSYSMVEDIINQSRFIISLPLVDSQPILLHKGDTVEIAFFRDDGQFTFYAEVVDRFKENEAIFLSLEGLSKVRRIQRRDYFRLKIVLPVDCRNAAKGFSNKELLYKAYTTDLSGGGMKIVTENPVEPNSFLECTILLSNNNPVAVNCKVIRCTLIEDSNIKYELGVSFINMTPSTRDQIVHFIFQQQRKLRKKGLL